MTQVQIATIYDVIAKTLCDAHGLYGGHISLDVLGYEIARALKLHDPRMDMSAFLLASHCDKASKRMTLDPNAWDVI